nr:SpoIID/LytB domain-containing protein [Natranaerobius thermophilus]
MVTNVVGLEDYLKSVVPSETYSSWDIEALKAQAVASRTYAIYSQQNNNYNDFDLTDCQNSQVYKGYQAENSKTTEAVNSTMGEAIYYNGDVINALYHSNSGGKTEDPENVWGSAIPYLSSVESSWDEEAEDSNSDIYNWEKQISREKISEKLNEDYDLGELKDIEILERTSAGRVKELIYRGTKGEEKIFGDKNRTPMGLKSTKFEKTSNREDTEVSIKTGTGRQKKYVERDQLYAVSADSSIPKEVTESQQEYYIKSGNGIREVRKILQFTFSGKGFGHGLGMSQWGAHGMALEGYNYREILNHYYSDQIIIE